MLNVDGEIADPRYGPGSESALMVVFDFLAGAGVE